MIIVFIMTFSACREKSYPNNEKVIGYNLTDPDVSLKLPHILREISGLTYIDSSSFACIQDEKGVIYIYDFQKDKIKRKFKFNIKGDYEGITRVDSTIYVLRSDGTLFEIADFGNKDFKLNTYSTGIPTNNNEGLCYDPDNHRLLIACKGKAGNGKEFKEKREIYAFDLTTRTLSTEPVFDFDLKTIKEFARQQKYPDRVRNKKKGKNAGPEIKFMTSDIGIHPITKKLFVLSAFDHMLFIFNRNGTIEHIEKLNPEIFIQAEGIAFQPNGEMLITNEGRDKRSTLLRFKYKL